jgi:hypothetical protein
MVYRRLSVLIAAVLAAVTAKAEESPAAPAETIETIGMAVFILLAVVISLSVVSKLLIVFGVVPREPETGFHLLVHGAANVVGGLTRSRARRRPAGRLGNHR